MTALFSLRKSYQTILHVPAISILAWSDHSGIDPDQARRGAPS
jgi:hypothetical protein